MALHGADSDGSDHAPLDRRWMVIATVASVLALLAIVGFLVWAILNAGRAAQRAETRLMVQEDLLIELETQGERIERQADVIRRLNELLVEMGEDQLVLLEKVDVQTETIETLVGEVESLQRETIVRVNDLELELVEVPGRVEVVTETPPDDPEPETEPESEPEPVPGRECSEMPPTANRRHCR